MRWLAALSAPPPKGTPNSCSWTLTLWEAGTQSLTKPLVPVAPGCDWFVWPQSMTQALYVPWLVSTLQLCRHCPHLRGSAEMLPSLVENALDHWVSREPNRQKAWLSSLHTNETNFNRGSLLLLFVLPCKSPCFLEIWGGGGCRLFPKLPGGTWPTPSSTIVRHNCMAKAP